MQGNAISTFEIPSISIPPGLGIEVFIILILCTFRGLDDRGMCIDFSRDPRGDTAIRSVSRSIIPKAGHDGRGDRILGGLHILL
jgi:hypothetical protein